MIAFKIQLSTGKCYDIKGFPNCKFESVVNDFILKENLKIGKIRVALSEGRKIFMNKTLDENKIHEGMTVVLMEDNDEESTTSKNKKIIPNVPLNNFAHLKPNDFSPIQPLNPNINPNFLFDFSQPQISPNFIPLINPLPPITNQDLDPDVQKCINFLKNKCNVPLEMIDFNFICVNQWQVGRKTGPKGYEKEYYAPEGWIGIALKVLNKYDNGDNTWLKNDNSEGEWYNAYHPIKSLESIRGILDNGFRRGPYQDCKDEININPLTQFLYPKCGKGVYFIPDIIETKVFSPPFNYLGDKFRLAFMCRVNPKKVRIADIGLGQESWIVNGDKLDDPLGKKREDEVRPYRILVYLEKESII